LTALPFYSGCAELGRVKEQVEWREIDAQHRQRIVSERLPCPPPS